ncbi:MAG: TonB family protein [Pyrinomonadaceae bacterium]|nr:TonB family protein [Pyrinomonadaceae bacterium]
MTARTLSLLLILAAGTASAQRSQTQQTELFAQVEADRRATVACEEEARREQIRKFRKPLPRITGHCWEGCPTLVVKPYYPATARRLGLKGRVTVNAIVDEEGKVIFAKFAKGNRVFKRSALAAAYASAYQPKVICGGRKIKFWWTINFMFASQR